jgi:hypothetical protein
MARPVQFAAAGRGFSAADALAALEGGHPRYVGMMRSLYEGVILANSVRHVEVHFRRPSRLLGSRSRDYENINGIKSLRMASQAYAEVRSPSSASTSFSREQPPFALPAQPLSCAYHSFSFGRTPADTRPRSTDHAPLVCAGSGRASACNVLY